MIIRDSDPDAADIEIRTGAWSVDKSDYGVVQRVKSFDTETLEAEIIGIYEFVFPNEGKGNKRKNTAIALWGSKYIFDPEDPNDPNRVITFKCRLRSCYAYRKSTGERIQ